MEGSDKKEQGKNTVSEIEIFSVPFASEEIDENITITTTTTTNIPTQPYQEQLINQAFTNHLQGNIQEAEKYYQHFIHQGFKDHRLFSNYGLLLKDINKLEEAEILTRKAIELKSDFANAHYNLGTILIDLRKLEEAEIYIRKAIALQPDFSYAHLNLGTALIGLGKLEEAEIFTRKAIVLKPDFTEAHSNLGNILKDLGKLEEAEISYRKAIALQPDYAEAYQNLSILELLQGHYQSGLKNYEFRFKTKKAVIPHCTTRIKRLDNEKLQLGEKLLVITEQGLGDTIQFMRYIPYLRNQGFDISFCAQEKLHTLIQSSGIDPNPLTPKQANQVSEGQWIPLLSVPRLLKVTPENPVLTDPYIHSTNELMAKWKNILSQENKPIVGINWQGNPKAEQRSLKGRSMPLELFSIISKNHDCKFLSLQKGFGSEQLENCSFKNKFVECQDQIDSTWNFLETAAIISNCDLVITSDTSIAHLSAGMGKATWCLLHYSPDWRWGMKGQKTFWYPSMKLFRQKERHNWQEVMEQVSNALKYQLEAHRRKFLKR